MKDYNFFKENYWNIRKN